MKINIQTLINKPELDFQGETTVSIKNLHSGNQQTNCIANVNGVVTRKGNNYHVSGTVETTIKLICDRCMHEFDYPIHADLYSEFSSDDKYLDENEDVTPVIKSSIDLSDAVLESIVMNIPMKSLCKEDCKGMCKKCGTNLDHSTCKCDGSDIDVRLEQFRDIFCLGDKK